MNKQTLNKYRERLEELQDRLRNVGTAVIEQARGLAGSDSTGELSHVPFHLADMGSEEYLFDINAVLAANEGNLANDVRDALNRIDQGTFGECEECHKSISGDRLEALPHARYCITCAEKLAFPAADLNAGRPRNPRETLAPEGDMGERGWRDINAVGDAGGGTAIGGLAGTNLGRGEPIISAIQDATGNGNADAAERHPPRQVQEIEPIGYESDEDRRGYEQETKEAE